MLHTMALERTHGGNSNEAGAWDKRYGNPDEYAYGTAPNVFIAAAATKYLAGKQHHVVEMASGEGRNVVFLAQVIIIMMPSTFYKPAGQLATE